MLLAIDVGNTNAVLGCFRGGRLANSWRISTHPIGTADEFKIKLRMLLSLEGLSADDLVAIVVSSVVPPYTGMLREAFRGKNLQVIDHRWPFSFQIEASPANQIGADRLVNAEAVVRRYGAPAVVVDSGTATTLCAITRDKKYLGGAIMPGIELAIQALTKNTAKLFAVELVPPEKVIGSNTADAIRSGILHGYASMIDGMVRKFKTELGEPGARVIATGGVSTLLKGLTTELTDFDPDLTLNGIAQLYEAKLAR